MSKVSSTIEPLKQMDPVKLTGSPADKAELDAEKIEYFHSGAPEKTALRKYSSLFSDYAKYLNPENPKHIKLAQLIYRQLTADINEWFSWSDKGLLIDNPFKGSLNLRCNKVNHKLAIKDRLRTLFSSEVPPKLRFTQDDYWLLLSFIAQANQSLAGHQAQSDQPNGSEKPKITRSGSKPANNTTTVFEPNSLITEMVKGVAFDEMLSKGIADYAETLIHTAEKLKQSSQRLNQLLTDESSLHKQIDTDKQFLQEYSNYKKLSREKLRLESVLPKTAANPQINKDELALFENKVEQIKHKRKGWIAEAELLLKYLYAIDGNLESNKAKIKTGLEDALDNSILNYAVEDAEIKFVLAQIKQLFWFESAATPEVISEIEKIYPTSAARPTLANLLTILAEKIVISKLAEDSIATNMFKKWIVTNSQKERKLLFKPDKERLDQLNNGVLEAVNMIVPRLKSLSEIELKSAEITIKSVEITRVFAIIKKYTEKYNENLAKLSLAVKAYKLNQEQLKLKDILKLHGQFSDLLKELDSKFMVLFKGNENNSEQNVVIADPNLLKQWAKQASDYQRNLKLLLDEEIFKPEFQLSQDAYSICHYQRVNQMLSGERAVVNSPWIDPNNRRPFSGYHLYQKWILSEWHQKVATPINEAEFAKCKAYLQIMGISDEELNQFHESNQQQGINSREWLINLHRLGHVKASAGYFLALVLGLEPDVVEDKLTQLTAASGGLNSEPVVGSCEIKVVGSDEKCKPSDLGLMFLQALRLANEMISNNGEVNQLSKIKLKAFEIKNKNGKFITYKPYLLWDSDAKLPYLGFIVGETYSFYQPQLANIVQNGNSTDIFSHFTPDSQAIKSGELYFLSAYPNKNPVSANSNQEPDPNEFQLKSLTATSIDIESSARPAIAMYELYCSLTSSGILPANLALKLSGASYGANPTGYLAEYISVKNPQQPLLVEVVAGLGVVSKTVDKHLDCLADEIAMSHNKTLLLLKPLVVTLGMAFTPALKLAVANFSSKRYDKIIQDKRNIYFIRYESTKDYAVKGPGHQFGGDTLQNTFYSKNKKIFQEESKRIVNLRLVSDDDLDADNHALAITQYFAANWNENDFISSPPADDQPNQPAFSWIKARQNVLNNFANACKDYAADKYAKDPQTDVF